MCTSAFGRPEWREAWPVLSNLQAHSGSTAVPRLLSWAGHSHGPQPEQCLHEHPHISLQGSCSRQLCRDGWELRSLPRKKPIEFIPTCRKPSEKAVLDFLVQRMKLKYCNNSNPRISVVESDTKQWSPLLVIQSSDSLKK